MHRMLKQPYTAPLAGCTAIQTESPKGSNGEHATSLFYEGNPTMEHVLRAGTGIYIPKERCLAIVRQVESVCENRLPNVCKL